MLCKPKMQSVSLNTTLLARQAVGRQGLCSVAVIFFFLFNDRLEQRDLRTYQTELHQIFWVGRHLAEAVPFGIGFAIGRQGTLPLQPILGAKSADIGETPSFLSLAFHNGWQDGKADGPY